jgi:hypothetical protein
VCATHRCLEDLHDEAEASFDQADLELLAKLPPLLLVAAVLEILLLPASADILQALELNLDS